MTNVKSNGMSWFGSMGIAAAMILSWDKWHSFAWMLLDGFFSWLYIIYYWLAYGFK